MLHAVEPDVCESEAKGVPKCLAKRSVRRRALFCIDARLGNLLTPRDASLKRHGSFFHRLSFLPCLVP